MTKNQTIPSPVPTKKPTINIVVDEDLKAAIEQWAGDEGRTQSNLCERLLTKAAKEAGYLTHQKQEELGKAEPG
jgi:hypothetical protein